MLSTAICMGLIATFIPPLGGRMLRLSGVYWLGTLLALVLYGVLFSLSLTVSPVFATPADIVWSSIFILLPFNVRSWRYAIDRNLVRWSLLTLVIFSVLLEFVVPAGSSHFPARVTLVGLFQLMGIAWLSWEMHRFDPRLRYSQLGLIQILTLMHAAAVLLRVGYTVWLAPKPMIQDDLFMSYTLMFQGVLLLLTAMVFNNHYLESLLITEEETSQDIRDKEQLLQAECERSEKLRLEQSRLLLMLEHQLRNPMSVLQLALSDPSVAMEPAQRAARSLKDMQTLLERCVFMDKLDHQAIVLNPELCDVPDLITQICQAHPQGDRVMCQVTEVPLVFADLILLNIVLSNLVDNALKYSLPSE
ncbi:MAG: sensor histidine kinase, partial [Betaproteobacteria bacterium]|nr:sensor histidine kinase [Betaproteobacteria bacterium]